MVYANGAKLLRLSTIGILQYIAPTMIFLTAVFLFDEPLSNLDAQLREEMRFEIRELQKSLGITAVYVTHDQAEALALSDRIAVMNKGIITQMGTPSEIYNQPSNRFVAGFIGSPAMNFFDVTLVEPTRQYYTCFFSNLYIGGFRDLSSIAHSYGTLASEYGINVVHDWATGIDRDAKTVTLAGGAVLPYDKLVLSPGIDFVDGAVPGWDLNAQNKMPHALAMMLLLILGLTLMLGWFVFA